MKPEMRVFPDVNELSLRVAEAVARTVNDAVRSTGRCSLALAGGGTPRTLYGLLASRFREQILWAHVRRPEHVSGGRRPARVGNCDLVG